MARTKPPDATALYHIGRAYERLNNPIAALAAYQRLLDYHPEGGPLAEASRRRLLQLNTVSP